MIAALLIAAAAVVGVLEFRDKVPPPERIDAAYLSDQVRSAVKESLPQARVITRENMLVLLQATGRKLEECEGECEVETGRRIGADLLISGELLRFGTQYKLNMKLHDTRSGELVAGSVASGATADHLDRELRPAVRRLLAPLTHDQLRETKAKEPEPETVRVRHLPFTAASIWLTAGYDWTVNNFTTSGQILGILTGPASAFGLDVGGDLFFRIAGPVYLGAIATYGLAGPNALLVAGGARLLISDLGLSGGFGYSSHAEGGPGAIAGLDLPVTAGVALRAQGSWRRSRFASPDLNGQPVDYSWTVWSFMVGVSLHL